MADPDKSIVPVEEADSISKSRQLEDRPDGDGAPANDTNLEVSNGKGKGKLSDSIVDRLQSSGRALFTSALSGKEITTFPSDHKGSGGPSASEHPTLHQSMSGVERRRDNQPFEMTKTPFRLDRTAQGTPGAFDAFTAGGSSNYDWYPSTSSKTSDNARSLEMQEALDGYDVVDLLSQPEHGDSLSLEEPEELTPQEAARLQSALFGSGSTWPFWDQLLNFNPDFMANAEASGSNAESHMGTVDAGLARNHWLRQWNDVLSSYTDEVWGDLGPLTKKAKNELQEGLETQGMSNPTSAALDRLRLILSHVRGH